MRRENIQRFGAAFLKRDLPVIALYAVATAIMTYPLILELGTLIPSTGRDIYSALWQNWWLQQVLTSPELEASFTPYLFHPAGFDATFQPRRWAGYITWAPAAAVFGRLAAYNINVLLTLTASGYFAFLLVNHLVKNPIAAWFGGALFAYYPQHVLRALIQPNTGNIHWMPLVLLGLILTVEHLRSTNKLTRPVVLSVGLAAVAFALCIYVNLKIGVLAGLLGAVVVFVLMWFDGLYRKPAFYGAMALFALGGVVLAGPILLPYVTSPFLDDAMTQHGIGRGLDLLSLVIARPGMPPFFPDWSGTALDLTEARWRGGVTYAGAAALFFGVVGVFALWRTERRQLAWVAGGLAMFVLALGTVLFINEEPVLREVLPYHFLQQNSVFYTMRQPRRFVLPMALAWGVVAGYGLNATLLWLKERINSPRLDARAVTWGVGVLACGLLLVELYHGPVQGFSPELSPHYEERAADPDAGAILDVPMGRENAKWFMYLQTFHGHPIAEGMSARVVPQTYEYIVGNLVLNIYSNQRVVRCNPQTHAALSELVEDDFTHLIVHKRLPPHDPQPLDGTTIDESLTAVPALYTDEWITVYHMQDVYDICTAALGQAVESR